MAADSSISIVLSKSHRSEKGDGRMALFHFGLLLTGRKRNGRSRTCAFIERRFCLVNWLERRRVETHVG